MLKTKLSAPKLFRMFCPSFKNGLTESEDFFAENRFTTQLRGFKQCFQFKTAKTQDWSQEDGDVSLRFYQKLVQNRTENSGADPHRRAAALISFALAEWGGLICRWARPAQQQLRFSEPHTEYKDEAAEVKKGRGDGVMATAV